jgi:hypothetical protein
MLPTSRVSRQLCLSAKRVLQRGKLLTASLIVVLGCSSGCTLVHNAHRALSYDESWNDAVIVMRNRNWSAKAWHKRKHNFCNERYSADFCAGFRQGYEDVANGSNGCTPAHPPRQYWSWEFQSAEGQARTSAWFSGYPLGARAAEEDGVGNYTQLQLSSGLQREYQQCGVLPQGAALYPIPATTPVTNPPAGAGTLPSPSGAMQAPLNSSFQMGSPVPMAIGEPTVVPLPQPGR